MTDFTDSDYDTKHDEFDFGSAYLLPTFKFLIDECRNWSEFSTFIPRMERIVPTYLARLEDHFIQRDSSLYKVLTHGDFHYTNIMYKGDGSTVDDLVLVGQ